MTTENEIVNAIIKQQSKIIKQRDKIRQALDQIHMELKHHQLLVDIYTETTRDYKKIKLMQSLSAKNKQSDKANLDRLKDYNILAKQYKPDVKMLDKLQITEPKRRISKTIKPRKSNIIESGKQLAKIRDLLERDLITQTEKSIISQMVNDLGKQLDK